MQRFLNSLQTIGCPSVELIAPIQHCDYRTGIGDNRPHSLPNECRSSPNPCKYFGFVLRSDGPLTRPIRCSSRSYKESPAFSFSKSLSLMILPTVDLRAKASC